VSDVESYYLKHILFYVYNFYNKIILLFSLNFMMKDIYVD